MKFLLKAVLSVTFFTVIDRILGFVLKIYLSRELGAAAMGVYQVALSIFFLLLTFTTSGIPLVVSKTTAKEGIGGGTTAAALLTGLGAATLVCALVVLLRVPLAKSMASKDSLTLLLLMLPGVVASGASAAFRGALWGKQRYTTISLIEVAEQVARIGLTVALFMLGLHKLRMTAVAMSAACVFSMLLCALCYFANKGRLSSPKGRIVPLLKTATPITFVRAASSAVGSLLALLVPFILIKNGNTQQEAMVLYGSSIGMALPLLYLPVTAVGSLAYVMIPTLSKSYGKGDMAGCRRQIQTAITMSIVIAALFVPAFAALGEAVGSFVYDNADAGRFLAKAAWLLLPISLENILSSMLNSLDLEKRGFVNYMLGALVEFAVILAFCRNFTIDMLIYALGAGWTLSSVLDLLAIKKRTDIRFTFVWPLVLSCALCFPATLLTKTLFALLQGAPRLIAIGVSGAAGCVFMFLLSLVFGILDLSVLRAPKKKKARNKAKTIAKSAQT